jgi:hypothetical protein
MSTVFMATLWRQKTLEPWQSEKTQIQTNNSDNKSLQLFFMHREGTSLYAQHILAAEAKLLFEDRIESNRSRVALGMKPFSSKKVHDDDGGGLINDCKAAAATMLHGSHRGDMPWRKVKASDGDIMFEQLLWKRIVNENLQHLSVFETNEKTLSLWRTTHDFDIPNNSF